MCNWNTPHTPRLSLLFFCSALSFCLFFCVRGEESEEGVNNRDLAKAGLPRGTKCVWNGLMSRKASGVVAASERAVKGKDELFGALHLFLFIYHGNHRE